MVPSVPREVVLGAVVIVIQLIYSQVYPFFLRGSADIGNADDAVDISSGFASPIATATLGDLPVESSPAVEPTPPARADPPAPSKANSPSPAKATQEKSFKAESENQDKKDESAYFAQSSEARSRPRKGGPKFRIGEIVRDKIMLVRGVIVGWDATCQAPESWKRRRLASPSWASAPSYLVLVDMRDLENLGNDPGKPLAIANFTVYSPEATLEKSGDADNIIINPVMNQFFNLFDTSSGKYVPVPQIGRVYAADLHPHYRSNLDRLPEVDAKGKPLLRIVEFGRMIAHGKSVPVVRKSMFLVATEELDDPVMFGKTAILLLEHDDNQGTLGVIVNKNFTGKKRKAILESADNTMNQMQSHLQQQERSGHDAQMTQIAEELEKATGLVKLARAPFVDLRMGGPVGLQHFPAGPHHFLLHPFKRAPGAQLALRGSGSKADPDLFYTALHALKPKQIKDYFKWGSQINAEAREAGQRMILFAGNSAWGPKQLAGEIRGSLHQGESSWGWMPATTRNVFTLDGASDTGFWKALLNSSALQRLENT